MNIKEKYHLINSFEKENKVNNYIYRGVPVWPILKQGILLNIEKDWNRIPNNDASTIFKKIRLKFKIFFKFFLKNSINLIHSFIVFISLMIGVKKLNTLYLSGTNAKRVKKENRFYDVFCDPIVDALENNQQYNNYIVLKTSNEYNYKKPSYHKSINIQLLIHFAHFLSLLFVFKGLLFKNNKIEELLSNTNQFLSEKIIGFKKISLFSIMFEIINVYILSFFFDKILKKSEVKIVFMICYYGPQGMAMCKACNNQGVIAVDIQHGVQGNYHYGYSNWENLSLKSTSIFPKEFWLWSSMEKILIDKWAKDVGITAVITGNMFLTNNIDSDISPKVLDFKKLFNKSNIILYTLDETPNIPSFLNDVIKKSNEIWLLRFHPRTLEKQKIEVKKQLFQHQNIEIDLANESNLYDLLKIANWHITELSSVVIEAAIFSTPSIIVSELGKNYYSDYILSNKAFFCNSTNSILKLIINDSKNSNNDRNNYEKFDVLKYVKNKIK